MRRPRRLSILVGSAAIIVAAVVALSLKDRVQEHYVSSLLRVAANRPGQHPLTSPTYTRIVAYSLRDPVGVIALFRSVMVDSDARLRRAVSEATYATIASLAQQVRRSEASVRPQDLGPAAEWLTQKGPTGLRELLKSFLQDENERVRLCGLECLVALGGAQGNLIDGGAGCSGGEATVGHAEDRASPIDYYAAQLVELLDDPSELVIRPEAAIALGFVTDERPMVVPRLLKSLSEEARTPEERGAALCSLVQLEVSSPEFAQALKSAAASDNERLRVDAVEALEELSQLGGKP